MKKDFSMWFLICQLVIGVLVLIFWGLVIWAGWHFVAKWW
jgi:TRAP-type C4-dicarboxylate transport system permease small subunit